MLNNTITVDPGLNTGIAIWTGTDRPLTYGIVCPHRIKNWNDRLRFMWNTFERIISSYPFICKMYVEETMYYDTNDISRTAAKRGDLFHLSGIAYGYATICHSHRVSFEFIPPYQWKGQMSKQATADRIYQLNGQRYKSDHITDAVGIGFGLQKRLAWRMEK